MGLMVRQCADSVDGARAAYLAACTGIATSTASISVRHDLRQLGQGVYYLMAAMALSGAIIMWLARHRLSDHPHSAASGG